MITIKMTLKLSASLLREYAEISHLKIKFQ